MIALHRPLIIALLLLTFAASLLSAPAAVALARAPRPDGRPLAHGRYSVLVAPGTHTMRRELHAIPAMLIDEQNAARATLRRGTFFESSILYCWGNPIVAHPFPPLPIAP